MRYHTDIHSYFGYLLIKPSKSAYSSAEANRQTNSKLGVLLMLGGMFMFSAVDAQAKFLTSSFHPIQIIWMRQLGLLLGVLIYLAIKGPSILKTAQPYLQVSRGTLAVFSAVFFVFGIRYAELADAVAVSFVAPFFLTIFGAIFLGEKVGIRRWVAVAIGFIGAMIIIRPGTGAVHPAVFLVVIATVFYAARQVIGRMLADTDKTLTTIAYTAIISSLLITLPLPFIWTTPETTQQVLIIISMSLMAAVGEVLVIKALEVAEAMVVAPIHYTLIIWGTFYGYILFGQLPDVWTWVGTVIIVSAGLFTFYRQNKAQT